VIQEKGVIGGVLIVISKYLLQNHLVLNVELAALDEVKK